MSAKEAKARIKINKLLEEAGWRLLSDKNGKLNVLLETHIKHHEMGDDFEKVSSGFVDYLLLDEKGYPLCVLEAKSEDKNPLVGKEQARKYAKSQNCRFVILSNGNLHYFWDLSQGNPHLITRFPAPDSIKSYNRFQPNPDKLISEPVGKDYITLTQMPTYANETYWSQANALMTGGGQPQFNGNALIQLKFPLPPLATQQAIVAEIEAEQVLVNANHELITRFEKKIQATLAQVWGEVA